MVIATPAWALSAVIVTDPIQVQAFTRRWTPSRGTLTDIARVIASYQRAARPVQVVTPGDGSTATMPDGSIIALKIGGAVFRDAEQLLGVAARQVRAYGARIYAQGLNDPKWWRYTGTSWVLAVAFDPEILADLP